MLKLFGHPDSGHAYKVRLMLRLAKIEHDYTFIDIFSERSTRPVEFRTHSRFQEVPLLLDDSTALVQSNAILIYLARKYGIMGGESPDQLQQHIEWLFWEANKIGLCMPQIRAHYRFDGSQLSTGAMQWLLKRYQHDVGILEQHFQQGHRWLVGSAMGIADCSVCAYLLWADEARLSVPPSVQDWLDRICSLELWQDAYTLLA
ncbi:MAG: glutathione S-transferase [Leptospiraceae bacterium]|nr:glutathione S-transferase [Leptospiraceae bacterium]